jgi:hypothetical protein
MTRILPFIPFNINLPLIATSAFQQRGLFINLDISYSYHAGHRTQKRWLIDDIIVFKLSGLPGVRLSAAVPAGHR